MNKHQVIELPEYEDPEEEVKGQENYQGNNDYSPEAQYEYEQNPNKQSGGQYEDDYGEDGDLIEIRGDGSPEMPTKTILLTLFLVLTGAGFIIGGMISYLNHSENGRVLAFLLFGIFLSIPGCYYSFQLMQAARATTAEEREEILEQIPV